MYALIPFLLDILKFTLSGLSVFFVAYSILKPEFERQQKLKFIKLKKAALSTTLPLRLQAYERVVLLIERINPASLMVRSHVPGANVIQLQQMLITEIQTEFQHNVTQQVYLSTEVWTVVRRLRDDTVSLINNSARSLQPEDAAIELSKIVLTHLSSLDQNPYDAGLALIKTELQELF